jgi:hypothetical protein
VEDDPQLGRFLAEARQSFGSAIAEDLRPLGAAVEELLAGELTTERAKEFQAGVARIGAEVLRGERAAGALEKTLGAAMASGLTAAAKAEH